MAAYLGVELYEPPLTEDHINMARELCRTSAGHFLTIPGFHVKIGKRGSGG